MVKLSWIVHYSSAHTENISFTSNRKAALTVFVSVHHSTSGAASRMLNNHLIYLSQWKHPGGFLWRQPRALLHKYAIKQVFFPFFWIKFKHCALAAEIRVRFSQGEPSKNWRQMQTNSMYPVNSLWFNRHFSGSNLTFLKRLEASPTHTHYTCQQEWLLFGNQTCSGEAIARLSMTSLMTSGATQ